MRDSSKPTALTIAGLDPSGGAGVVADTTTFAALGCHPMAVITSLTYQNESGVFGANHQSAQVVRDQIEPLLQQPIHGVKTGMLPNREVIDEVARFFADGALPAPVVDPVMISTSGHRLMEDDAVDSFLSSLIHSALLITPNIPEAERLTNLEIKSETDMRQAADKLRRLGARAVLIKGGHMNDQDAVDLLDHQGTVAVFRAERVRDVNVHGTGCMLSAAIAAGVAKKLELERAVREAKAFVLDVILSRVKNK